MLFIVLAGYWLGPVYGVLSGLWLWLLDTITGAYIVHPVQYVLDYLLAFAALGLSGLFRKWSYGLQIGYIAGVFGRYVMVFISGLVFFGANAPEGQPAAVYSAIYNFTYIAPEAVITFIIISLPAMKYAVNTVTKTIVPPNVYVLMNRHASLSAKARLVTGAFMGAFGGMAFVLSSQITRIENLSVIHFTTGMELFLEAPRRIPRMIERNTEQIFALQTVGVLFIVIGITLLFSILSKPTDS